jgi:hypothetical protein
MLLLLLHLLLSQTMWCVALHYPTDEPLWRQLLKDHLRHSNPEVAQQAAAALAQ